MNLNMFLVFPGVLITIGVALLLISIIIIVVAYKTADPKEEVFIQKPHEEEIEIKEIEEPQNLETTKVFKFPSVKRNVAITEIDDEISNRINDLENIDESINIRRDIKPKEIVQDKLQEDILDTDIKEEQKEEIELL